MDLDHSNPELCSSATHFDVLGSCGRRSLVKKKKKGQESVLMHTLATDRQ